MVLVEDGFNVNIVRLLIEFIKGMRKVLLDWEGEFECELLNLWYIVIIFVFIVGEIIVGVLVNEGYILEVLVMCFIVVDMICFWMME